MEAVNQELFQCINLDNYKSEWEINILQKKLRSLRNNGPSQLRRYMIVASPHTLVEQHEGGDKTTCT